MSIAPYSMSNSVDNTDWYEVCASDLLMQGDIIQRCEVLTPVPSSTEGADRIEAESSWADLIVVTQSCDLVNRGKIDYVLLAEIYPYDLLVEADRARGKRDFESAKFREKCVQGAFPAYFLLKSVDGELALPWSLVDFRKLHTLHISTLRVRTANLGARLRLRAPYREHFAQAFARYFMRVGLPVDAREFVSYKPPAAR
jgi:hypothetical protein